MSQKKKIIFSDPKDSRTGFLSNESKYGFVIEDKRWKTVEHYVQAKKFRGTQYEEEIRLAPTVYQVKRLTKQRDFLSISDSGKISKKITYGRNGEYSMRKDWKSAKRSVLKEAIFAKFTQNKHLTRKLLDTRDAKLVDVNDPLTGIVIEEVRGEINKKDNSPPMGIPVHNSNKLKDFGYPTLSPQEKQFVSGIITMSKRISEMEGWDKIFREMIEDVVYILTSKEDEIKNILKYINSFYKISWTKIYHDAPNTYEIIHELQDLFQRVDNTQGSQCYLTVAAFLLVLIEVLR